MRRLVLSPIAIDRYDKEALRTTHEILGFIVRLSPNFLWGSYMVLDDGKGLGYVVEKKMSVKDERTNSSKRATRYNWCAL